MVQAPIKTTPAKKRDVQVATISTNTQVLRSRTWDRLKFEVEYSRQKGTTSNSYLIEADKIALIDPPGQSFTQIYLETLEQHLDLQKLDYIILQHVNPNRLATVKVLAAKAPQAQIICSKPAVNALEAALTFPQQRSRIQVVRDKDTLDLGQGHQLQFISAITPRWVDGLCTYDPQSKILYTDKFFGAHFCDEPIFDDNWKQLDLDRRFYFDCLHASQTKQLETALAKFTAFDSKIYAPAHGSLIKYSLSRFSYDYRSWCQEQKAQEFKVVLLYASAYGNTATLASAIAHGLIQSGVAIESINCELASTEEITTAVQACDGFIIGSPTLGGHAPTQIQTALGIVLANVAKTKLAGVFGSYGWSGEAIAMLENKLKDAHYSFGFEPIRVRFSPTATTLKECLQAGINFTQKLKKTKKLRTPRQAVTETQIDRTEQAVGRIVGSLCVLTTCHDNHHNGVLTSWVSQATFNPPGVMIALAPEQNANLISNPGDKFVLNILNEGGNIRRNFSHQSRNSFDERPRAADRRKRGVQAFEETSKDSPLGTREFDNVTTKTATNGCLIIEEALAHLECTVQSNVPSGDRNLIYAVVEQGEVSENSGITAMQHRKSGSHY
ncbi:putative diflavin flavoprotein A 4 [Hyella patelloides LEGE 07179]|uniref:Putative diflavin flavoprotein A 4 n=1 Tax=Hyella patelloides LEGE 07179 TaxID=945734 RepID=A0A563VVE2_9CYAN|nr:diflavin flavoprotein [Hyella patelloides]VEP15402.1 putative diflavin flavoprotein A 4 [Hyella patelloides LEGE 07179]